MKRLPGILRRAGRTLVLLVLVLTASTALVRFAPGYLSDAREMDRLYGDSAREQLRAEGERSASLPAMLRTELLGWFRGDFGQSRQYNIPVRELLSPRLSVTGGLLLRSLAGAWLLAFAAALLSSTYRAANLSLQLPAALLLALPAAALATLCLLTGDGGPVLALTLLLAARDFKFLHRILRGIRGEPSMVQARAQGIRGPRLLVAYVLPSLRPQLLALATLSLVTALSALVPIEVVFSVPGVGQLAWNAALNRDLPVLLAVTVLMGVAVTVAQLLSSGASASPRALEAA